MRMFLLLFIAMMTTSIAIAQTPTSPTVQPALKKQLRKQGSAEQRENKSRDRYVKAFPAAKDGMVRYMIMLPYKSRAQEKNFRIEIIVGKQILTDGVNHYSLGGSIKSKPLKGWGFTFYEVEKLGPAISTLIGVPPGTKKVMKFVAGPSKEFRYNSRIPMMIYVPKGAEVHYKIWTAPKTSEKAEQG